MKKFKASVDEAILRRVTRIFDASNVTVFGELLQNARRAGATRVCVSMRVTDVDEGAGKAVEVEFSDNGVGVLDPSHLLRLGSSEWVTIAEAEDPAGMGFFCLSHLPHVRVESYGWRVDLTPECFRGECDIQPVENPDGPCSASTMVRWTTRPTDDKAAFAECDRMASDLQEAARYCDIPTVILETGSGEGNELTVGHFLDGCEGVRHFDGYSIGVRPRKGLLRSLQPSVPLRVCFHGVVIGDEDLCAGFNSLPECLTNYVGEVRVSVHDAVSGLQMVLPARNALIHSDERDAMRKEAEATVYHWLAKEHFGRHSLPFEVWHRAQELGVDIGPAQKPRAVTVAEAEGKICVRSRQASGWRNAYGRLLPADMVVLMEQSGLRGYPWYDALPSMSEAYSWLFVTKTDGSRVQVMGPWRDEIPAHAVSCCDDPAALRAAMGCAPDAMFVWVKDIHACFELRDADGNVTALRQARVHGSATMTGLYEAMVYFGDIQTDAALTCIVGPPAADDLNGVLGQTASEIERVLCNPDAGTSEDSEELREDFEADVYAELVKWAVGDDAELAFRLEEWVSTIPEHLLRDGAEWRVERVSGAIRLFCLGDELQRGSGEVTV